jgi:hypothetical protein
MHSNKLTFESFSLGRFSLSLVLPFKLNIVVIVSLSLGSSFFSVSLLSTEDSSEETSSSYSSLSLPSSSSFSNASSLSICLPRYI